MTKNIPPIENKTWKQKLFYGLSEYLINTTYLTVFFGVYALSRRLMLEQYGIYLDDYFIGLIKALVIAKVIMIGAFFRSSRKYENKPLMIPVMYKVIIFMLWVVLFDLLEALIRGYLQTHSVPELSNLIQNHFSKMWAGGMLLVAVSFIPFFALKELSRVVGHERFRNLFFKARTGNDL